MTSKWEPARLQREIAELQELESEPMFSRVGGYMRRTGPGLLQSAMTLGAGSAVASVVAGASFGYDLLWVQPVAMFLGVFMLAALGNVVLTTGERPYKAFARETNRFLIFLWALGSVIASVVWHFPQYGLAAGAARDLADLAGVACSVPNGEGGVVFTSAGLVVGIATSLQKRFTLDVPALMAGLAVATIPMIILYAVGQRTLVRGLTAGFEK